RPDARLPRAVAPVSVSGVTPPDAVGLRLPGRFGQELVPFLLFNRGLSHATLQFRRKKHERSVLCRARCGRRRTPSVGRQLAVGLRAGRAVAVAEPRPPRPTAARGGGAGSG